MNQQKSSTKVTGDPA